MEGASTGPLLYSSYFGGEDVEYGIMTLTNDVGEIILVGTTEGSDLPITKNAIQNTSGGADDGFITKFSSDGQTLLYCTFLGGSGNDGVMSASFGPDGDLYVGGITNSSDFPTTGDCYQPDIAGDYDPFVCKVDLESGNLVWSTYIGGSGYEGENSYNGRMVTVMADEGGGVWVTGFTESNDFPVTKGCYQNYSRGGQDVYICRLSSDGRTLEYSTYIGGTGDESPSDIAFGPDGDVYISGGTFSDDFPTTQGVVQTTHSGNWDGFVSRLDPTTGSLDMSLLLGRSGMDVVRSFALGSTGEMYLTGYTNSLDFPTTDGAYQEDFNGNFEAYACEISADGSALEWSSLLGGTEADLAASMCLLGDDLCIVGYTTSDDFPVTTMAFQEEFGGDYDATLTVLDRNGTSLLFSSYLGGTGFDLPSNVIATDEMTVLLTGLTTPDGFPITVDALDRTLGLVDAFVTRVLLDYVPPVAAAGVDIILDQHQMATFNGSASQDNLGVVNWTWTFTYNGSLVVIFGSNPTYTFHEAGEYQVKLEVRDRMNATAVDSVIVTVRDTTPPVADAGTTRFIDEHQTIVLDGSRSTDNLAVVNWTWTFLYDGVTVTLDGPDPEFTFDIPGQYNVTLNVTDVTGLWDMDGVMIFVVDITAPVAVAPDDMTVDQHETVTLDGGDCTDNLAVVNWTWGFVTGAIPVSLYGEVVDFTFDEAGVYKISLFVADASGNIGMDDLMVTVVDVTPPVADAGEDLEANPGTTVYFDATGSKDNVLIASYKWIFVYKGQDIELDGTVPTYFFEVAGTYLVTLTVTDLEGNWAEDAITVTMMDIVDPTAVADLPGSIDQGSIITLDGSLSHDNIGIVDGRWTFFYGGVDVSLDGLDPVYTFPEPGELLMTLTVFDEAGNSGSVDVVLIVADTVPPVAVAPPNMTLVEGTTLTLDAIGSTDNQGIVDYLWKVVFGGSTELKNGARTTYFFGTVGHYTITLLVADADGNTDTDSLVVSVRPIIGDWQIGLFIDGEGKAVAKAKVIIEFNGTTYEGKTDNSGHVTLRVDWHDLVAPGKVTVRKDGWEKLEFEVDLDEDRNPTGDIPAMERKTDDSPAAGIVLAFLALLACLAAVRIRWGRRH